MGGGQERGDRLTKFVNNAAVNMAIDPGLQTMLIPRIEGENN